jgi:hypothetical protein
VLDDTSAVGGPRGLGIPGMGSCTGFSGGFGGSLVCAVVEATGFGDPRLKTRIEFPSPSWVQESKT